jgi:hypothetical protein
LFDVLPELALLERGSGGASRYHRGVSLAADKVVTVAIGYSSGSASYILRTRRGFATVRTGEIRKLDDLYRRGRFARIGI